MQVTETSAEGLRREYKVVVPAGDIEDRVSKRLDELARTIRMPGFRPGKVPVTLLRKQYGRSVMGEVLEQAVSQGSQQAISERELRPALRPKIEVTSFDEGADLEFTMALEVLPQVPDVDLKGIELTRQVAEVGDEVVAKTLENFAARHQHFEPLEEPRPSQDGDQLILDFEGRIEGEPFEDGNAQNFPLVLGSGFMMPGFEERLNGAEAGSDIEMETTFPEDYPRAELAGKAATFEVKVKEIRAPSQHAIDDAFAKEHGFDDLEAMRNAIRESVGREYANASRAKLKRALLDRLAETYRFEVPPGMVELEFESIWKQKNEIKVEQQEINSAVLQQAQRYPGQEQKVLEFFKSNPRAIEQLRAPIYEDKVVDFILQMATVSESAVSPEELMRDPDEDEDAGADATAPEAKTEKEAG
jgi:trigger factor